MNTISVWSRTAQASAVQVTPENRSRVAEWCGASVADGAGVGDWVIQWADDEAFEVYSDGEFTTAFADVGSAVKARQMEEKAGELVGALAALLLDLEVDNRASEVVRQFVHNGETIEQLERAELMRTLVHESVWDTLEPRLEDVIRLDLNHPGQNVQFAALVDDVVAAVIPAALSGYVRRINGASQ